MEELFATMLENSLVGGGFAYLLYMMLGKFSNTLEKISDTMQSMDNRMHQLEVRMENMERKEKAGE